MTKLYNIIKPVEQLPPREIRSLSITGNIDIDLIKQYQGIATGFELVITAGTAIVTINEDQPFTLLNNVPSQRDNVNVWRVVITGGTQGYIIFYLNSLNSLTRFMALEN